MRVWSYDVRQWTLVDSLVDSHEPICKLVKFIEFSAQVLRYRSLSPALVLSDLGSRHTVTYIDRCLGSGDSVIDALGRCCRSVSSVHLNSSDTPHVTAQLYHEMK
jgi:hypothetical protein